MPLISWTNELSVGVGQLDSDHQMLFGIINELYDAMREGHGDELLESIFSRLKEYTYTHFWKEEFLMKSYGYADYPGHKLHHEEMINQLDKFMVRYAAKSSNVSAVEVSQFLQDWLMTHIKQEDFRYKPFFKEKGVI